MLDLHKRVEKINLVLTKKSVTNIICRVKGSLDASRSMVTLYRNGTVQETINRFFALGYRFDDNQRIDLSLFSNEYVEIGEIALEDVQDLVSRKLIKLAPFSGTNFAETIYALAEQEEHNALTSVFSRVKAMFSPKVDELPPIFSILITDGDNTDEDDTIHALIETRDKNVFYMIIGIGDVSFTHLKKYSQFEHVDCMRVRDLSKKTDNELYEELLSEKFLLWMRNHHSSYIS